jgi:putative IMPACT (imprinted ancient) family translation regulator
MLEQASAHKPHSRILLRCSWTTLFQDGTFSRSDPRTPMLTLERSTSLEQIIKKSRFIATAGPVASEQGAKDFIAAHSDPGANHNCWAWRVGQSYRCTDDGEPSGTAGKPILQAVAA